MIDGTNSIWKYKYNKTDFFSLILNWKILSFVIKFRSSKSALSTSSNSFVRKSSPKNLSRMNIKRKNLSRMNIEWTNIETTNIETTNVEMTNVKTTNVEMTNVNTKEPIFRW